MGTVLPALYVEVTPGRGACCENETTLQLSLPFSRDWRVPAPLEAAAPRRRVGMPRALVAGASTELELTAPSCRASIPKRLSDYHK